MVEVLLHCSKDSVKDAATEAAKPAAAGETGEMQVRERIDHNGLFGACLHSGRGCNAIICLSCPGGPSYAPSPDFHQLSSAVYPQRPEAL